jgi:hypothetical protein
MVNTKKRKALLYFLIFILANFILFTQLTILPFGEEQETPFISKGLPSSLQQYYKGRRNKYALSMIELGRLMGASFEEAYSKNYNHSLEHFQNFREQYDKISQMVPEWRHYFPQEPLQETEQLIMQKAPPEKIRKATKDVENVCTNCHVYEMFKVQSTYHWKKFSDIYIMNEHGEDVSFHTVMIDLSNKLAVIPTTIQRKDFEAADLHFKDLSDNFIFLEMSCNRCHHQPREYFVDQRVKAHWYQIGGLIRHRKSDIAAYRRLVDQVYEESCIPCHRVHMPVAFMQLYLEK